MVVAIIAILAGLLMPALRRARESARASSCMSNLRQIGIAANTYASDFGGYPLSPYQKDPANLSQNTTPLDYLVDLKYLPGIQVFLCPTLQQMYNGRIHPNNMNQAGKYQANYSISALVGTHDGTDWVGFRTSEYRGPRRLEEIVKPSSCILAGDALVFIPGIYAGSDAACGVQAGIATSYNWKYTGIYGQHVIYPTYAWSGKTTHNGPNLLFFDGHAGRYIYGGSVTSTGVPDLPRSMVSFDGTDVSPY